jgi:hypothetical protein
MWECTVGKPPLAAAAAEGFLRGISGYFFYPFLGGLGEGELLVQFFRTKSSL